MLISSDGSKQLPPSGWVPGGTRTAWPSGRGTRLAPAVRSLPRL